MMPLLLLLSALSAARAAAPLFTGNAAVDFAQFPNAQILSDDTMPDVSISGPNGTVSGWDVKAVHWAAQDDQLFIGIECWGVCGDADGNGIDGNTSEWLRAKGGVDTLDLAGGEAVVLLLDFDLNVADFLPSSVPNLPLPYDYVLGVPAKKDSAGCTAFGLYRYLNSIDVPFAYRVDGLVDVPGVSYADHNPRVTIDRPSLIWSIKGINELRASVTGGLLVNYTFPILAQLFAGSSLDAGVGEDYVPRQTDFFELNVDNVLSIRDVPNVAMTGDVEIDFDAANPNVVVIKDGDEPDVDMPTLLRAVSGWDIKDVRFLQDEDSLHIGINCFGICGDADGNGVDGCTSNQLAARGGTDLPGFIGSEMTYVSLDLGSKASHVPDGNMDVIVGYVQDQPFGIYNYTQGAFSNVLPGARIAGIALERSSLPTTARAPDVEFKISSLTEARRVLGFPNPQDNEEFTIAFAAFAGSFEDDGIGEDWIPERDDELVVTLRPSVPYASTTSTTSTRATTFAPDTQPRETGTLEVDSISTDSSDASILASVPMAIIALVATV